jgi:hypothetical protein
MKKLSIITAGAVLLAAVPATIGLTGNASFAQNVPVRLPSQAVVVQDRGFQGTHVEVGDVKGVHLSTSKLVVAGDDKSGLSTHVEAGSHKSGSSTHVEAGSHKSGSSTHVEASSHNSGSSTHVEAGSHNSGSSTHVESGSHQSSSSTHVEAGSHQSGSANGSGHS